MNTLSQNVILIENLSFKYQNSSNYLLEDINLRLSTGDRVGIIGGNGCGKSTLSKLLLGIYSPTEGTIKLFNKKVNWNSHFPMVGYIGDPGHNAEELGLPVKLTIGEIINALSALYRIENMVTNVEDMLTSLGLSSMKERKINNLSTGERKRLMVCLALLRQPDLLILDEPFDGLDQHIVIYVSELIKKAMLDTNMALLLISHNQIEIDTFTNKVYRLQNKVLNSVRQRNYKGAITVDSEKQETEGRTGEIIGKLIDVLQDSRTHSSIQIELTQKDN